jgi:hypothetical protein
MKRALFALTALVIMIGISGCANRGGRVCGDSCPMGSESCAACANNCDPNAGWDDDWGDPQCRAQRAPRGRPEAEAAAAGPATGTVTYPYYTLHGPRDFLDRNPARLGP